MTVEIKKQRSKGLIHYLCVTQYFSIFKELLSAEDYNATGERCVILQDYRKETAFNR